MTKFKYFGNDSKLIEQNQGEIIDVIEGCLIDNLLIATKRGYMAMIETYINCWTSCYTVYFSTESGPIYEIWDNLERGDE